MILLGSLVHLCTSAAAETFTSAYLARWNVSHGRYLIDVGLYLEALEAFDTAIEMADGAELRDAATLEKASLLAVFLDGSDAAVRLYDDILRRAPEGAAAEHALLRAGMILFDEGKYRDAAGYFERYLDRYPQGSSRGSAEFLLGRSRAELEPQAPPPPPAPATDSAAELVRIRIMKGHNAVRVESDAPLTISPQNRAARSVVLAARSGLVSIDGAQGASEVTLAAGAPLRIVAGKQTRRYRGSLKVRADGNSLRIINHVGLEEYLYGVVTRESVATWPAEALKAQAIASRTYALYQMRHRRDREYDMVDDEGSQVYGGVEGESGAAHRAVDDTRGVVLVHRGRPIYAMFTSNTGWHTGDPKFVFDQPLAYLGAVPDPYSPGERMGRWTRSYSAAELQSSLSQVLGRSLGPIQTIRAVRTCPSGRLVRVAIVDDKGAHEMRTRPTLGRALKLPEILLDVRREGDRFTFTGGGFGHGIGLSQWGAKAMADKGMKANQILDFYYRDTQIISLDRMRES